MFQKSHALASNVLLLNMQPRPETDFGDSYRVSTAYIGPHPFVCVAMEVKVHERGLEPLHGGYAEQLQAVYDFLGGAPTTQKIDGRTFVIAIVPMRVEEGS